MNSTRLFLVLILGFAVAMYIPTSRARILEFVSPLMAPIYTMQTEDRLQRIVRDLETYERASRTMPRTGISFQAWLEEEYVGGSETMIDSWGSSYRLRVWSDSFAVVSPGKDRRHGTDDDIRGIGYRIPANTRR